MFYEERDGSLRLHIESMRPDDQTIEIDADNYGDPTTLGRVVVGSYVLGRSVIRINTASRLRREQIENIREVTQRLLGIGIVEETEKHLLLQSSINPANFPIPTMMKRLYMVVSTMFKEVRDGLRDGDLELLRDAISRKHEADTTYWLIARLLSLGQRSWVSAREMDIGDPVEIIHCSLISRFLDLIAEHTEAIAQRYITLEKDFRGLPGNSAEILDQMNSLAFTVIDKAMSSVFTGDVKIASDAMNVVSVVELKENEFLEALQERVDSAAIPVLRSIVSDVKIIVEYASSIAEMAINKSLEYNQIKP